MPPTKKQRRKERELQQIWLALLDLFSVCDDVYTEDNAFEEAFRKMGYGRMYRKWKEVRALLDPEFDIHSDERPNRWLPKKVREAKRNSRNRSRRATG